MGAAVWGIYGIFLSIPFIAVLKIYSTELMNYPPGEILGDNIPTEHLAHLTRFRGRRLQTILNR